MPVSKLSAKSQVTLPRKVRETLDVAPGDFIVYAIADGEVSIRKARPFDVAFHAAVSATLDEWASPEDDEAFRDL